jgi:hypothetical protein
MINFCAKFTLVQISAMLILPDIISKFRTVAMFVIVNIRSANYNPEQRQKPKDKYRFYSGAKLFFHIISEHMLHTC